MASVRDVTIFTSIRCGDFYYFCDVHWPQVYHSTVDAKIYRPNSNMVLQIAEYNSFIYEIIYWLVRVANG